MSRRDSSLRDSETEQLWHTGSSRRTLPDIHRTAWKKLAILNAAPELVDPNVPPRNRLEALTKDRTGQHSIRINDQYLICFRWEAGNAYDVEIVDDH